MSLMPGVPWSQTCWANHTVEFRGEQGSTFQRKRVLQGPGPKIWLYTSQIWNWRSNEKYKSDAEFCFKTLVLKVYSPLTHLPWSTFKSRLFLPLGNKMTLGLWDSQKLFFFFHLHKSYNPQGLRKRALVSLPGFKSQLLRLSVIPRLSSQNTGHRGAQLESYCENSMR